MPGEIITLQIGQAGIQIGNALWELYCMEHSVSPDGYLHNDYLHTSNNINALFYHASDGRCIPRSIFFDFEPTVIDEVRTGRYRNLFNPTCLVSGMEDAANNYARGFFSLGKKKIEKLMFLVRKLVMQCDHFVLFEIINSYSGGTGSGLTSLLLEYLNEEYAKKYRFSTGIFPSTTFSESTVGPYNSLLYTHTTFDNLDCGILIDNESLYTKLADILDYKIPTYNSINRCLSQMLSCIFLSHRYQSHGAQHLDVDELMTNSVPYPRIHFPVLAYAPILNATQIHHEKTAPESLTRQIFKTDSHFLNCPMQATKYISCCLLYRGKVSPKQVYDAISLVKSDYQIQFVDWCPTGFKIGINYQPSMCVPHNILATNGDTLCMLSGNIGIKEAWCSLRKKYSHLVSKRSFIHWFIGEGLEESDFLEANENIQVLERDYEEIGQDSEQADKTEPSKQNSVSTTETNDTNKRKSSKQSATDKLIKKTSTKESIKQNSETSQSKDINNDKRKHSKQSSSIKLGKKLSSKESMKLNSETSESKDNINANNSIGIQQNYSAKPSQNYSDVLLEDIVSKLDSKMYGSNQKMLRKIKKLQIKLNRINKLYCDEDKLNDSESLRAREESFRLTPDMDSIKRALKQENLKRLSFSSPEEIICNPNFLTTDSEAHSKSDYLLFKSSSSCVTSDSLDINI